MLLHPGADLLPGGAEQGPDDPVAVAHAAQSAGAGSAQQVEDQRLRVVVGIVRHRHGLVAVLPAEFVEPGVAQFACRHLDALSVFRGPGAGVETFQVEGESAPPAPGAHERFVAVGFLPAQAEVAVRDAKPGSGE